MAPPWRVLVVPELEKDLGKKQFAHLRERLEAKFEELERNPLDLGKPLRGRLAGCRRVKLGGTYRLLYTVRGDVVYALVVAPREGDKVYDGEAERRLSRL